MTKNTTFPWFYPSAYQNEFVNNFLDPYSPPNHILLAPVGSGKTVTSLIIVNDMVRAGARRILILVPAVVLVDQYLRVLNENVKDINIFALNRKVVREIDSLHQKELFLTKSLAIATFQQARSEEILQSILSTSWDLIIIDEVDNVAYGGKHAAFIQMVIEKHIARRILIMSNQLQTISSYAKKRSFLNGKLFNNFEKTKWRRKDIFSGKVIRDARITTLNYERTKEEIDFIKKYTSLSKWLLNSRFQNKIRSRLVSSSLYAAEESLRNFRNRLVHEDLRDILDVNETGREFIKDEELLGDTDRAQIDRKYTGKDLSKLMNDLSITLELLDSIQIDSKFNILSHVVKDIQHQKQRTWIYVSYQSTISFLHSSLSELAKDVYQIHGQTPSHYASELIQRFREDGGFLISSTSRLMGVNLALDNLILYDTPESENLIYTIFTRMSSSSHDMSSEPVNIIAFDDISNVIKSERNRLEKMQRFLQQLVQEEM